MRSVAFLLFLLLPALAFGGVHKITLIDALDSGFVDMKAASNGARYYEKALQLDLNNKTGEVLLVQVDPGLIFQPKDSSFQNLVLPGSEVVIVPPRRSTSTPIQSFCGSAQALAPVASMQYTFQRQGDSVMVQVSNYISKHRLNDRLGQAAIWALTDEHSLEGIFDPARPKESGDLLLFMEKLTRWKQPEYYKIYEPGTTPGQPAVQRKKLTLAAQFELKLTEPKVLSMGVYNGAGKEMQVAFKGQQMKPGVYKLVVSFEAEGASPGDYFLRVSEGAAVLREQQVRVEED
jgi:hypothetical protein